MLVLLHFYLWVMEGFTLLCRSRAYSFIPAVHVCKVSGNDIFETSSRYMLDRFLIIPQCSILVLYFEERTVTFYSRRREVRMTNRNE